MTATITPAVTIVLLDHYGDRLPAPKPPKWETDHETGLAPSQWRTCPNNCDNGRTVWKGKTVTCQRCQGRAGWHTDPYDTTGQEIHANSRHDLDLAALTRTLCDLDLKQLERIHPLDAELVERVQAQHPCWRQLEHALHQLRTTQPHEHFIVWAALILNLTQPRHLIPPMRRLLVRGVLNTTTVLKAGGCRPPRWAIAQAELQTKHRPNTNIRTDPATRKAEARRLHQQGRSIRYIAKKLGYSKTTIERDLAA